MTNTSIEARLEAAREAFKGIDGLLDQMCDTEGVVSYGDSTCLGVWTGELLDSLNDIPTLLTDNKALREVVEATSGSSPKNGSSAKKDHDYALLVADLCEALFGENANGAPEVLSYVHAYVACGPKAKEGDSYLNWSQNWTGSEKVKWGAYLKALAKLSKEQE